MPKAKATTKKKSSSNKTTVTAKVTSKKINFEQQFELLEQITAEFEAGNYDLETGLKKFEEGLQIAQELQAYLETVENTIESIKANYHELTSETDED